MIRNILILTLNDLAIAIKNKSIYLIIFIPFFVFVTLKLIDSPSIDEIPVKIGFIQNENYAPEIMLTVKAAGQIIKVTWVQDLQEGVQLLKEKKIDGVLLRNTNKRDSLKLLVLKKESFHTIVIVEKFLALQKAAEGYRDAWISDIEELYDGGIQRQALPTWILMLVLLIGFIILPAQVAEEKEKRLILALLQTPIREVEWLIAKVLTGMLLTLVAILLLHILSGFGVVHVPSYMAFIAVGGFCFSAFGVFLGFLCRNQASARTLGVVFYLPHLLPSALSDFSQQLSAIAPLLPSYQFYGPVKTILLEEGTIANLSFEWGYLLLVGALAFYLSSILLKKRWLMK
ncbi:ABC transporter permease [Pelovirga terrestris]|uniref:ABC transporter permease n=1 Tax=Pelovirga terrestris TaxID=2771352 RepID=A0A8J6QQX1_9BACT|nr:ABC transporter permease [Pelovirga terrestris]MBD1400075.1 ABC transporter permease [Pelovirga terrestris]